jgi:hypothetical protein
MYRRHLEHQTDKILKKIFPNILWLKLTMQNKESILKATREKQQVIYKGKLIRIRADFSTETLK